jgi:hypothetical protein
MFTKCDKQYVNNIWIMQYVDGVRCKAIKSMETAIFDCDYPCMSFFMNHYTRFPALCQHCVVKTLEKIKSVHSERYNQFLQEKLQQVYMDKYKKNEGAFSAEQLLFDDDENNDEDAEDPETVADFLNTGDFTSISHVLDN